MTSCLDAIVMNIQIFHEIHAYSVVLAADDCDELSRRHGHEYPDMTSKKSYFKCNAAKVLIYHLQLRLEQSQLRLHVATCCESSKTCS